MRHGRLLDSLIPGLLEVINALALSIAAGDAREATLRASAFAGYSFAVLLKQYIGRAACKPRKARKECSASKEHKVTNHAANLRAIRDVRANILT